MGQAPGNQVRTSAATLPGFLLLGGFFTDTSESEEEDEEAKEEEEADLAMATGSPLTPSDSGLESESEADGGFWKRQGHGGERADPSTPYRPQPTTFRLPKKSFFRLSITGSPGCAYSCLILHLGHSAEPPQASLLLGEVQGFFPVARAF